jgi:hypothetical protein
VKEFVETISQRTLDVSDELEIVPSKYRLIDTIDQKKGKSFGKIPVSG